MGRGCNLGSSHNIPRHRGWAPRHHPPLGLLCSLQPLPEMCTLLRTCCTHSPRCQRSCLLSSFGGWWFPLTHSTVQPGKPSKLSGQSGAGKTQPRKSLASPLQGTCFRQGREGKQKPLQSCSIRRHTRCSSKHYLSCNTQSRMQYNSASQHQRKSRASSCRRPTVPMMQAR